MIKNVKVELENGEVLEFGEKVVIFAEDKMSETEQKVHGNSSEKVAFMTKANTEFLMSCTKMLLNTLSESKQFQGADTAVMAEHCLGCIGALTGKNDDDNKSETESGEKMPDFPPFEILIAALYGLARE